MDDCIFCKIIQKEIPTEFEKETENLVVFKDLKPTAPIHLLIVPKKHIKDVTEIDGEIWQEIAEVARLLAAEKKLAGFRLVHNAGEAAEIHHLHVHLIGPVTLNN